MKNVLFVTYDFPYPTNTGGKNRAYHMLKHSGRDIKKYLFSFVRDNSWRDSIREMEEIGIEVVGTAIRRKVKDIRNILGLLRGESIFKTIYYSHEILADLLRIIADKKIDIVHFESFYTAFYISDAIKALGVRQIFGTENIEFKVYGQWTKQANILLKPLYEFAVDKIRKEEIELFKRADLCIAVSKIDAKVIKEHTKECKIVRNGVDIDEFKFILPKNKKGNKLLFVGNFTYFPNVDAINYFYNEVFKNLPSWIKLTIVGKKVNKLKFIDDPRIEAKEFVPRIQDEYQNADIMVAPIRLGGGTNFKIIEAMASGIPVISLPHRLEGIDAEGEKHLLIANNSNEFRSEIDKLLADVNLREKIAENARELVEREYSWEVIGDKLGEIWKNL